MTAPLCRAPTAACRHNPALGSPPSQVRVSSMRVLLSLMASMAALGSAAPAAAQAIPPVAPTQAVDSAVAEGCVPVVSQRLSLNAPSEALARAGLRAWQPNAVELAAFSDFPPGASAYAQRPSTVGSIVLGQDPARGLCRIAVVGVTERDIQAIQSYVEALVRNLNRAGAGAWTGSIDASPALRFTLQTGSVAPGPVGAPQLILTFTREQS